MFSLLREAWIQISVPVQCRFYANVITCAQVAYASLEQVLFDGPAHKIVVNGRLCDFLVELNRLVEVCVLLCSEGSQVCRFQPELVGQSLFEVLISLLGVIREGAWDGTNFGIVLSISLA
jgi:hypothetical protein